LFKDLYGVSPKKYQQNCRYEVARRLLETTDRRIDQIAAAVGFESISSFSAWFRKIQQTSPTEWRESALQLQVSDKR